MFRGGQKVEKGRNWVVLGEQAWENSKKRGGRVGRRNEFSVNRLLVNKFGWALHLISRLCHIYIFNAIPVFLSESLVCCLCLRVEVQVPITGKSMHTCNSDACNSDACMCTSPVNFKAKQLLSRIRSLAARYGRDGRFVGQIVVRSVVWESDIGRRGGLFTF